MIKDTTQKKTILCIIDDDEDDLQFIAEAIREALAEPCEIYLYKEAETAIRTLRDEQTIMPDVIFLDMLMPRITKTEALLALREIPALAYTPIIICSSSEHIIQDAEIVRANATHHLVKASSQKLLVEALKNVFSRKHDAFLIDPR